jgi:hypothetical protein
MAEKKESPKSEKKSSKTKKHKVKAMHIRKADSGGFVAQHEMPPDLETGVTPPGQEHVLPDIGALQQHVGDHFGDEEGEEKQPAQ